MDQAVLEKVWYELALQAGVSLTIRAETESGCLLASDQTGRRGRSSEEIGRHDARNLLEDLKTGVSKKQLLSAIQGHILAQGQLVSTYQR
ncbi:hypothetical protein ACFLSK_03255 [Chloroflexota bacterium]